MKRYFEIEWRDDLGAMWMNNFNLLSCLLTTEHCGDRTIINVEDVTNHVISPNQRVWNGSEWVGLEPTSKNNTTNCNTPKGRKLLLL